jgi:uncharacterized membrane protein YeaQ/YmgE (transglycosylase-associated protein family)
MVVGIIGWIILGLVAGLIASKVVNLRGDDPGISIALAGMTAVAGGWLYSAISGSPVSNFNIRSLLFAGLAALLALVTWHVLRSRATRHGARSSW